VSKTGRFSFLNFSVFDMIGCSLQTIPHKDLISTVDWILVKPFDHLVYKCDAE
jgi:hypothetical protein